MIADGISPTIYTFTILVAALINAGERLMAFKLYLVRRKGGGGTSCECQYDCHMQILLVVVVVLMLVILLSLNVHL